MVSTTALITVGSLAVLGAMLWPIALRDLLVVNYGFGRKLQPLSDFPYRCRRIAGPGLEACEDMWLSERTRQLFLACSTASARKQWMPNIGLLDVSGRNADKIIAMSIDKPIGSGFEYRELSTPASLGVDSDGFMTLVGLTGIDRGQDVELYLVNNRPSLNMTTGTIADQRLTGANSTIDRIRVNTEQESVEMIRTYADPHITTPNNIATKGDGSFYITNDHGPHKTGWRHGWSPILKTGDVTYCNEGGCRQVQGGIGFPNGLSFGVDGLLYVPSSATGDLRVYRTEKDGSLVQTDTVSIPYPLDNLSLDAKGDLWVAGIPDIQRTIAGFADPLNSFPPATVLRIKKSGSGYVVDKVLEDADGSVLPAATAVTHDAKTGRLFVSGVFSPFISVCEPM